MDRSTVAAQPTRLDERVSTVSQHPNSLPYLYFQHYFALALNPHDSSLAQCPKRIQPRHQLLRLSKKPTPMESTRTIYLEV